MEVKQVSVECVDVFWDKVKSWIERVVKQTNGRHTLETTYNLSKQGTMTMFLITHKKKNNSCGSDTKNLLSSKKRVRIFIYWR